MSYGTLQIEKMTTESGYSLGAGNASSFKNRIINGGMVIDQRNAGASVTPSTGTYTLDRWRAYSTNGTAFTVQQSSTAPAGFQNSLKVTSTAATSVSSGDYYFLMQRIEGYNIADLALGTVSAKAFTVSFWVYSSLTGTFGGAMLNGAQDYSYPFQYTISSANTWTQITLPFPAPTSGTWTTGNSIGLTILLDMGAGSSNLGTAGSWQGVGYYGATGDTKVVATNGATFYITGVQLEVGTVATSFDYRPYGAELALCQRYYCKSFNMSSAPSVANVTLNCSFSVGNSFCDGNCFASFVFPTTMRAAPTVVTYSPSNTAQMRYRRVTSANVDGAQGGVTPVNEFGFTVVGSYGGSGANSDITVASFDFTASAEI